MSVSRSGQNNEVYKKRHFLINSDQENHSGKHNSAISMQYLEVFHEKFESRDPWVLPIEG